MAELNLIPYRIKEQRRKKFRLRQYIAVGAIVFCILFFGVYFPMGTLLSLQAEEDLLNSQIEEQKAVISENQELRMQAEQLKHYVDQVTQLDLGSQSAVVRVKGLESYIPKGISLIWLNYNDAELSMEGIASTYSEIGEFAANLQMSDDYRSAVLTEIKLDDSLQKYHFLLSFRQGGISDEESHE